LIVNVTPLEPQWEGLVTIEISNTSSRPVKIYANEGICQFIFLQASTPCQTSYADKGGKYNFQIGVVEPRL
jgi:dCTP deaminase